MKNQVKRMQELSDMYYSLRKEISQFIETYIKAIFPGQICVESPNLSYNWRVEEDVLEVEWSDYWAYGGEDSGSFDIPIHFLYDEKAFEEYQEQQEARRQAEAQAKIRQKEQVEKAQLKKLKEKYEN